MKHKYYSDVKEKLSDIISAHPDLLLTLSHFGIGLGVGDKSVREVCEAHGVEPGFFLLICNVYTFGDYVPTVEEVKETDMRGLVPYLQRSHAYYLGRRLPHIGHHLEKIEALLPPRAAAAIRGFYNAYMSEVTEHFGHEETVVFPHIAALLNGTDDGYSAKDFVAHHGNLEDTLEDLIQIIFKYLPPGTTDDDAIDMIFDILEVKRDLHKHSLIEERILVPYVLSLEKVHK